LYGKMPGAETHKVIRRYAAGARLTDTEEALRPAKVAGGMRPVLWRMHDKGSYRGMQYPSSTYNTCSTQSPCWRHPMARSDAGKQNVTISISPETVRKARILAARRSTSISRLLSQEIERLVGAEEAWERAERSALALLEQGFHLGGLIVASRDEWHER